MTVTTKAAATKQRTAGGGREIQNRNSADEAACPVAGLLREVANAHRALTDLDASRRRAFRDKCGVTALGMRPMMNQRIRACEHLASTMSATSEVGAVWQTLLAYSRAYDTAARLEENKWSWSDLNSEVALDLKSRVEVDLDLARNCLFSAGHVMAARLNHPDLNVVWATYQACLLNEEEREGACVSGVIAAVGKAA